jgi:GDP-L-fucose synthase
MAVIPNSVYGPYDNFDPDSGHVLSALIHKIHMAKSRNEPAVSIWGSGTPRREFIHADDVADACIHLMQAGQASEGPFNLGTGSDVAIMELAQMIARIIGYRGQLICDPSKPDGTPRKLLDSSRIRQLGWSPTVTLEQGLEQTYQWYLVHHHQEGRA